MKILIASDLHWPTINGVATFSRNLAKGLADRGHEVIVIAPSQRKSGRKYIQEDGNHVVMRTMSLPFPFYQNFRISLTPQREVRKIINDFKPDVIHIQSMLGIGRATILYGKKLGIPVVATNHAMPENLIDNLRLLAPFARTVSSVLKSYAARFHSNADYVTFPTQAAIDIFSDYGSVSPPIQAISNGVDLSRFSPGKVSAKTRKKFGLPNDRPILTYLGRLDSEKHLSVLLRAAAKILSKQKAHVLIIGSGNDWENLRWLARDLNISNHVSFTGKVIDEEITELHKAATVFCMPSPAELQSIATLEAMASGAPVVVVDQGAVHELCEDGKNGYVCKTDDEDDMAAKITAILKDKSLQKKMSARSLAIAKKHDISKTLDKFEKIYKQLI